MLRNLLTDVDGVLLDWATAFRDWAERHHGPLPPTDVTDPNYAHEWLGLTREEGYDVIQQFQRSEALADLPPYPDAVKYVRDLRNRGHLLICVTSCGQQPDVVERRERNLKRVFGDIFSEIVCLPVHASKAETLQRYARGIWVDDATYHAEAGLSAGHTSYFMHRDVHPQPTEPTRYAVVRDWVDIYEQLVDTSPPNCCS